MLTRDELRDALLARRKELAARVHRIERDFRHDEQPLEKDAQEQSIQLENDDVLGRCAEKVEG